MWCRQKNLSFLADLPGSDFLTGYVEEGEERLFVSPKAFSGFLAFLSPSAQDSRKIHRSNFWSPVAGRRFHLSSPFSAPVVDFRSFRRHSRLVMATHSESNRVVLTRSVEPSRVAVSSAGKRA